MTKFLAASLALCLWAAPALAEEPADCSTLEGEAKEQCDKAAAAAAEAMDATKKALEALGDCSDKEGDDKTACETEKATLEAKLAPPAEAAEEEKGGKAQRSNTNRMEAEVEDE